MEKVSIIVPIYNVEKYLKECLDSIINQTYKNIEILLINDGSPDNSKKIMEYYKKKDDRILCYYKENGGLSDARNFGLDKATGNYITFVDSDDYIDRNYIEKLYNQIKKDNSKISQCGFYDITDKGNILKSTFYKTIKKINKLDYIYQTYDKYNGENVVTWNKMYDKSIFDDIRFPYGKIHEDEFVIHKIIDKVDFISIVNEPLYYYRKNENSIMGKKYSIKRLDIIDAFEIKIKFYEENNYDILIINKVKEFYIEILLTTYINSRKYISNKKINKNIANKIKFLRKNFKISNRKLRIKISMFYISPTLYYNIIQLRKKIERKK